MKRGYQLLVALTTFFLAGTAQAHSIGSGAGGFSTGLAHPFMGPDHLLAMLAVGIWSAQLGGRALWRVPMAFMVMMGLGSLLTFGGLSSPVVEAGVASSVLVLGLLIAMTVRFPLMAGMLLVGLFALFHGHAHGLEWPRMVSAHFYVLGFLLATGLLHAVGVSLGIALTRVNAANGLRVMGGGIAATGLVLWVGI